MNSRTWRSTYVSKMHNSFELVECFFDAPPLLLKAMISLMMSCVRSWLGFEPPFPACCPFLLICSMIEAYAPCPPPPAPASC